MKLRIQILLIYFIVSAIHVYGQDSEFKKFELGIIVFAYQENLIGAGWGSPVYVQKYVPLKTYGIFAKAPIKSFYLRSSFRHFNYHNEYQLTKLTQVRDYDENVNADYKRSSFLFGIEKRFLQGKLKPYMFSDFGFYISTYDGTKTEFSGVTLETYYFDLAAKGFGLTFRPGIGVEMNINTWLGFIFESSFTFENLIWKEDDRFSFTGDYIKINPINKIGVIFKI